jgi:hypothetical protein
MLTTGADIVSGWVASEAARNTGSRKVGAGRRLIVSYSRRGAGLHHNVGLPSMLRLRYLVCPM